MKHHYAAKYLLNPTHRITVNLAGCGGTGSQVLTALARMNQALKGLGHPGLHVTVFDPDVVTEANVGRQLFSPADIGNNKAVVSVTRINRYFQSDWLAIAGNYTGAEKANIHITCIDSAKGRVAISKNMKLKHTGEPYLWGWYWLDFGNNHSTGQVVLGTIPSAMDQPENGVAQLNNVVQLFPGLKKMKDKDAGPSCSIAQSLGKQDLFINSTLAQLGMNLLWKLFREGRISHQGLYLNLSTMQVNPIKL